MNEIKVMIVVIIGFLILSFFCIAAGCMLSEKIGNKQIEKLVDKTDAIFDYLGKVGKELLDNLSLGFLWK